MSQSAISRRDILRAAGLAPLGLSLRTDLPALKAVPPAAAWTCADRSCILILNHGGPSHLDLWDPKPDAPLEIRGPFRPIRTTVPGIALSELLPRHATIANLFSLVRSCYHTGPAVHAVGAQLMQSGLQFSSQPPAPHIGSVISYLLGPRDDAPAFCVVTAPIHADGRASRHPRFAGILGAEFEPVILGVPSITRKSGSVGGTFGQDASRRASSANGRSGDKSLHSQNTLADSRMRRACDLAREPRRVRERYGAHRFGQSCLLARRLVEARVRLVTVETPPASSGGLDWDIHGRAPFITINRMRDETAPMYDQASSALLEDLDRRGLLPTTLVCCVAEFGRTPRINTVGGRDHWPHCFTCCFAGGGVQGGRLVGCSDASGSYPRDRLTPPADIAATIYHSLGLDPQILSAGFFGTPATPSLPAIISELF